jgi:hypothetical protein
MALTQEQKNEIIEGMKETAAAQVVVMEEFEKLLNLDSFKSIYSFGAIYPGNNSSTAHPIMSDFSSTVSKSLIEAMSKCSNDEESLMQFMSQIAYIYQPRLYNYYKAGCFISAEHEAKSSYPKASHTFNNSLEFYTSIVEACKDKYNETTSLDAEIEEHILHTKSELEKLSHTHSDL